MAVAAKKKAAPVEETAEVQVMPEKKTAAKKTAAKKDQDVKAETAPEAPKKPAAKKTAAKKSEPEATVTIQFNGKNVAAKDVLEAAKKAYIEANPDSEIKSIDIYVKPEEGVAYYAVNGEGSADYKIEL
ncbi:MAG: hypothetical protein HFG73_09785 [Hungatella sp.]|nr:hypothetical protein [Hungatella sp.]